MMERDLIASGRWDEAMELEYDDQRRVAAERGAAGYYDAQIEAHKARFGGGPW